MGTVLLSSGGLDSAVSALLLRRSGVSVVPLFVNYGQRAAERELSALKRFLDGHGFGKPTVLEVPSFGKLISSGLTDSSLDIVSRAFLPCRNLLLIVTAVAYAQEVGVNSISMGLLSGQNSIFPDQSDAFLSAAQHAVTAAIGTNVDFLLPLRSFNKQEVVALARELDVTESYSCHAGNSEPCGRCLSCLEFSGGVDYDWQTASRRST